MPDVQAGVSDTPRWPGGRKQGSEIGVAGLNAVPKTQAIDRYLNALSNARARDKDMIERLQLTNMTETCVTRFLYRFSRRRWAVL